MMRFGAALELVVDKRITGLPVVDGRNRVVGVVSDFDLLAIDLPGEAHTSMFPSLDQSWEVLNFSICSLEGVCRCLMHCRR